MAKSLNNVWTYIGIIFIFSLFMIILSSFGNFLTEQHTSGIINLPILKDYSQFNFELEAAQSEIQDPISYKYNTTEGTSKDDSIPFLFSQDKSSGLREKISYIYRIPSSLIEIFGIPDTSFFSKIIDAIFWLLSGGILISMVYFIRGIYI